MVTLLLKASGEHKLIVNKLFPVEEDLGIDLVWYEDTDKPGRYISALLDESEKIGVDKNWPAHFLISLMDMNAASGYVNASPIIDRLRMIKDEEEKELIVHIL